MVVVPGTSTPSVANMVELVRTNSKRYVDISFQDSEGTLIDISETMLGGNAVGELDLEVTDLSDNSVYSETYWPKPVPDERRIAKKSTGKYGLTLGTEDFEAETAIAGTYLANWHVRQNTAAEDVYATQVLEIVSPRTLSLLPKLRFMVDKTIKPCIPEDYCFLGFVDSQLIACLQMGLCMMNEYQPYPCWTSIDNYDIAKYGHVLIKAAMYQLVTAQGIFAIDTDVPSYNDQGHSFVLVHFSGLMQVANLLKAELDRLIPDVKRHHVESGTLGMEIKMNTAVYQLFSSSPYGALVRGFWSQT